MKNYRDITLQEFLDALRARQRREFWLHIFITLALFLVVSGLIAYGIASLMIKAL
ncbi:MAG TPA: hypothetical protein VF974_07435 [Patescibacteria group bacterium]